MRIILLLIVMVMASCSNLLDEKPDIAIKEPQTLDDLQALLNNENLNNHLPSIGDIASDYYYLSEQNFNSRTENTRKYYTWDTDALTDNTWNFSFSHIFYFNQILDRVDNADLGKMAETDRKRIKGTAHFFRGLEYFQLAIIFAPQFQPDINDRQLSIPIKRTADVGEDTKLATVAELFYFIEKELLDALDLLPVKTDYHTRPDRLAALVLLSRFYLSLGNWEKSLHFSKEALTYEVPLMDFNDLSFNAQLPFARFNEETLFFHRLSGNESILGPTVANVADEVISLYHEEDRRLGLFFSGSPGNYIYKGSFTGLNNNTLFGGITTAEVFLNHAECLIRTGEVEKGLTYLNHLLDTRYNTGKFVDYIGLESNKAITLIKEERLKELCFKGGIRWMDLKRYSVLDGEHIVLKRVIGSDVYSLDLKQTPTPFVIPKTVGAMPD